MKRFPRAFIFHHHHHLHHHQPFILQPRPISIPQYIDASPPKTPARQRRSQLPPTVEIASPFSLIQLPVIIIYADLHLFLLVTVTVTVTYYLCWFGSSSSLLLLFNLRPPSSIPIAGLERLDGETSFYLLPLPLPASREESIRPASSLSHPPPLLSQWTRNTHHRHHPPPPSTGPSLHNRNNNLTTPHTHNYNSTKP